MEVNYFHNLLGQSRLSNLVEISMVKCKEISEDEARLFEALITDLIIFDTIRKMKKNKAHGSDGVNVEFFLATWNVTGPSFCVAVRYFLTQVLCLQV